MATPAATASGLPDRVPAWYMGSRGATCCITSSRPPYAPTGKPAADDLAHGGYIGGDAVKCLCAAVGHSEAGYHLVEYQQRAVGLGGVRRSPFEETGSRGDHPHVAGHRLHDDGGDVVGPGVEQAFQRNRNVIERSPTKSPLA